MSSRVQTDRDKDVSAARRRFLANCGKFAVITPPVVTLMLSSANRSYAVSYSGTKKKGNNGYGNGGGDPAPGNSGNSNSSNSGEKKEDKIR